MDVLYADSLFFLNGLLDYLLLLTAGQICSLPLRRWRLALAALLGGAYALLAVLLPRPFSTAGCKLLCGALLPLLAFGPSRRCLRTVLVFFAVSAAFGGAVHAVRTLSGGGTPGRVYVPVSSRVLLLSFAVSYAVLRLVFDNSGRRSRRTTAQVRLLLGGRWAEMTALLDSGNELADPASGLPVLVAEAEALAPLFPPEVRPLLTGDPLAALSALPIRARLLACGSATAEGLLLCFTPERSEVDGRKTWLSVAVTPQPLSPDGAFQALLGTEI